jgi:asparagine synthase (glutamine-hydrolysing)
MCGIAGRMEFQGAAIDAAALSRARDSLLHRGPDDAGLWIDGPIGLAHRRLSVLDLSPRGHQPMHLAGSGLSITFNGEVYNFREVRAQLVQLGHAFESDSDTEVILAAWAQWGPACLPRLNGMFAFALWDARARRLFLVRDRMGVKPLYYRIDRERLVFGSTLQALLGFGDLAFTLSRSATECYLDLGYVAGEASIFEQVQRLGAGQLLEVDTGGGCTRSTWWSLHAPGNPDASTDGGDGASEAGQLDRLESLLDDSVALRLISDVPVGAFLSGGIDSSLVVALMRRHSDAVRTYTIGFEDPRYDESAHAAAVASHLGVQNTRLVIGPSDLLSSLDALTAHYDEPFADSSALPTLLLSGLARSEVTVALSGDGGDELFGGYPYYGLAERLEPWRQRAQPVAGLLAALARRMPGHRAALALAALATPDLAALYARFRSPLRLLTTPLLQPAAMQPASGGPGAALLRGLLASEIPAGAQAQRLMDLDLRSYLESDILVKVDRASMAYALEARNPFLDWRVVEHARAMAPALKLHPSGGKRALRLLLARHLPAQLIDRPKAGFVVPIREWLRSELQPSIREAVEDGFLARSGWIDRDAARRACAQHASGARNHEHLLWAILMFERWHRRFCP